MEDKLRGTGRTTRMLRRAVDLAIAGKQVLVVVDHGMSRKVTYLLSEDLEQRASASVAEKIKIRPVSILRDLLDTHAELSIRGMRGTVVLIDHHVIEERYRALWRMMHEFDADPVGVEFD